MNEIVALFYHSTKPKAGSNAKKFGFRKENGRGTLREKVRTRPVAGGERRQSYKKPPGHIPLYEYSTTESGILPF